MSVSNLRSVHNFTSIVKIFSYPPPQVLTKISQMPHCSLFLSEPACVRNSLIPTQPDVHLTTLHSVKDKQCLSHLLSLKVDINSVSGVWWCHMLPMQCINASLKGESLQENYMLCYVGNTPLVFMSLKRIHSSLAAFNSLSVLSIMLICPLCHLASQTDFKPVLQDERWNHSCSCKWPR